MSMTYILILFVILLIAGFLSQIFRPQAIGKIGEMNVAFQLGRLRDEYHVFNDVTLEDGGRSTQIDHVVISPYGIFVIETKNYQGKIYGGDRSDQWSQYIWGHKYTLHNPVRQNYGHIMALMRLFGLPKEDFISIVVFTDRSDLHIETNSIVIRLGYLVDVIKGFQKRVLSDD